VAEVLVTKALNAARELQVHGIVLGGGVIANARVRQLFAERASLPLFVPSPALCTDNGAMVAACGYHLLWLGRRSDLGLDVAPDSRLD